MKRVSVFLLILFFVFSYQIVAAESINVPPRAPNLQSIIDSAKNNDEIILEGEYLFDRPLIIKGKENFSLSAKGKVTLINRNGTALIVENSNISINEINFFRTEIALECSDSIISTKNCKFRKNRVGIQGIRSIIISDKNLFDTNFLAAIMLIGQGNNLKIIPSTSFKNNYTDVYSVNSSSETFRLQGNKIFFGSPED